ncbi:protein tyrosine phosphatase domain-containing protein 1 [Orussus abietinus]|uniref:protein tyrosine phosphatase domain-containing protein 1 n=1 Tax=Orussus abietinus TaxID=222816 RepID=UPI0006254009|nr:protein tyrosine phosphatase domain-containing protein 1 [Orussus abietinus]
MDVNSLVPAALQTVRLDLSNIPAGYNKISENLRKLTPRVIQCAIFCGGSRCKYENPKSWLPVHMAIQDVYSHWVTDDVLAMARPSTTQIAKKDIITQFHGWSIKTIINLQTPGEHASCGGPLEESGFTYDPNDFMKNGIYYYNFAWKDYDETNVDKLLDMVKVVAFAVQEGRVAIHCHAGLGRTGVLIACYLVYSLRVRASDAIRFVRMKRPCAIQTRGQIACIQEFEHFILPQMIVFPINGAPGNAKPSSLRSHLRKQQNVLHGYEQRTFKHIPKIVFTICERILQLCDSQNDNSPAEIKFAVSNVPFTQKFISHVLGSFRDNGTKLRHSYSWAESFTDASFDGSASMTNSRGSSQGSTLDTSETMGTFTDVSCTSSDAPSCSSTYSALDDICVDDVLGDGIQDQDLFENDCYKEIQSQMNLKAAARHEMFHVAETDEVMRAFLCSHRFLSEERKKQLLGYQVDLNTRSTAWQRLELETDLHVLSNLLLEWLETLKRPVLELDDLSNIVVWGSRPQQCFQKLEHCNRYLLEYLLRFLSRLRPMTNESQGLLVKRLMAALTQQRVWVNKTLCPEDKNFQRLRNGTAGKLNEFFVRVLHLIEEINTQEFYKSFWTVS